MNDQRRSLEPTLEKPSGRLEEAHVSPAEESRTKEKYLRFLLAYDVFILLARLLISVTSNSMTMYTTAVRNILSVATKILSLYTFKKVSKGETEKFNYGYGKLENVTSVVIAVVLLLSFIFLIYNSISRILNPVTLETSGSLFAMAMVSVFSLLNIYTLYRTSAFIKKGDRSPIVHSQQNSTASSLIINLGSLAALGLGIIFIENPWASYIDPVFSLILSGYVLYTAIKIAMNSVNDLLDRSIDESHQMIILKQLADYFNDYSGISGVKTRKSGGIIYISLILEFPREQKLGEVQDIIDKMENELEGKIMDCKVTITPRAAKAD